MAAASLAREILRKLLSEISCAEDQGGIGDALKVSFGVYVSPRRGATFDDIRTLTKDVRYFLFVF